MNDKTINNIVWWIPIRKYRDKFRERIIENEFLNKFNLVKDDLADNRFEVNWKDRWLCLHDKTATTPIYIDATYYTTWFSRILAQTKPKKHVDVGSAFYSLILPLSAFIDIDFYDIRPVPPLQN